MSLSNRDYLSRVVEKAHMRVIGDFDDWAVVANMSIGNPCVFIVHSSCKKPVEASGRVARVEKQMTYAHEEECYYCREPVPAEVCAIALLGAMCRK